MMNIKKQISKDLEVLDFDVMNDNLNFERNYQCTVKAINLLVERQHPNLCSLGDRTSGASRIPTLYLFKACIDQGFLDGGLIIAFDVINFLSKDREYVSDWGNCALVSQLLTCTIDVVKRRDWTRIEAAIQALRRES